MGRSGTPSLKDRLQNLFSRAILGGALLLPYRLRVALVGRVMSHVVAPLAGWRKRIRDNLDLVTPEMPQVERERIVRKVADNVGRTLIEIYSGRDFTARAAQAPITGPGHDAFLRARARGRPVILVSGHFGNYDVARARLIADGHEMGALYRRMSNVYFNAHYVRSISEIGTPMFEQGRRGMMQLVRHLRGGGVLAILTDLNALDGVPLNFFGKPARSSLVTAQLALKYDAALIPTYAIREADGLSFRIVMQDEIAHSTAEEMTQAVNDGLEHLVRDHMEQWFWIHRRWKMGEAEAPGAPAS